MVESLQRRGLHHDGAITLELLDTVVSDAAAVAEAATPGAGGDALVWEELRVAPRRRCTDCLVPGVHGDRRVDCGDRHSVGLGDPCHRRDGGRTGLWTVGGDMRWACPSPAEPGAQAARTMAIGVVTAACAAFAVIAMLRLAFVAPDQYVTDRILTSFISRPDAFAVVVAVLAGVVGMLSLTEGRSGALIGVLVSVTTIPAIGNIGAPRVWPVARRRRGSGAADRERDRPGGRWQRHADRASSPPPAGSRFPVNNDSMRTTRREVRASSHAWHGAAGFYRTAPS